MQRQMRNREGPWTIERPKRANIYQMHWRLNMEFDEYRGIYGITAKSLPEKVLLIIERFRGKKMPGRYRKQVRRLSK